MKVRNAVLKMYRFKKNKVQNGIIEQFEFISFKKAPQEVLGYKEDPGIYNLLSMHTHPSYLSVLQFGQMYNSKDDIHFLKTILTSLCALTSLFVLDFCKFMKGSQAYFDNLSEDRKLLIYACVNHDNVDMISNDDSVSGEFK